MSFKTILLAAFLLVLFGAAPAWACSCVGPQTCPAKAAPEFAPDAVVFIGTVTAIGAPAASRPGKGLGRSESAVEFRVTEMFSGGKETTITGFNPVNTSCAVDFEVGRSYLIHTQAGNMTVGGCSVQEPGSAETRIVQLRAARDRLTAPAMLGKVTLPPLLQSLYLTDLNQDALMGSDQPAVDVAVIARSGDSEYRIRTGRDGRFEFRELPPAEYQLTVAPPEGTDLPPNFDTLRFPVTAGMSCGFDIPLFHNTMISFTVVDAKGIPISGELLVSRTDVQQPRFSSRALNSGQFQFRGLPPGRYRIEFIPSADGRLSIAPRAPDPQEVAIRNGEQLKMRIVVP